MAQRLLGNPPSDWIAVDRKAVHGDTPLLDVSCPRVDYYYDARDAEFRWFVAPSQADPPAATRSQILAEAEGLINGDRQADYGPPSVNFLRIATGWNILKPGLDFTPADVARMMAWVKLARSVEGYKHDTAVDLAGYAAIYGELSEEETK